MKIHYFSPTRFPTERAHGAQIAHMCNAFSQSGARLTLVVPDRKNKITEDPFSYYGIRNSFKTKLVPIGPLRVGSRVGFFISMIIFIIHSVLYVWKKSPDCVYSRDEFVLLIINLFFKNKFLVWESHEAKYNFAARALFRRGIKCVAISDGIKEFYVEKGIDHDQVLIAHDGIDDSFFGRVESKQEARQRLNIVTDMPVAMYIGGLDQWKGVETFFEASKYNQYVSFVVIGGGDSEVKKYKKIYPKIHFIGPRPYSELKDNQQAADILVIPNTKKNDLSAKYTSPLKLFTHLASKVPLLVSDIPSLRNVVSEEQVAFFTPDDAEDLAKKLDDVILNSETAIMKTKNAFELSKLYTWEKRAKNILAFIKNTNSGINY